MEEQPCRDGGCCQPEPNNGLMLSSLSSSTHLPQVPSTLLVFPPFLFELFFAPLEHIYPGLQLCKLQSGISFRDIHVLPAHYRGGCTADGRPRLSHLVSNSDQSHFSLDSFPSASRNARIRHSTPAVLDSRSERADDRQLPAGPSSQTSLAGEHLGLHL
jgi:hypothetical protein